MALTREQRVAAIRWLGRAFTVHQVVNRLRRKWGIEAADQEIRNLDPTFLANLPPDDFTIWRTERDKVDRGEVPGGDPNWCLAIRSNAAEEFLDNNEIGKALAVLREIEMARNDSGTPKVAGESVDKIERMIVDPAPKSEEQM